MPLARFVLDSAFFQIEHESDVPRATHRRRPGQHR